MICDRIKYTSTDTLWNELTAPENVEYGKDFLSFRTFTNLCIYLSFAGYYALIFFQNAMGESVYDLFVIILLILILSSVVFLFISEARENRWIGKAIKKQHLFTDTRYYPKKRRALFIAFAEQDLLAKQKEVLEANNKKAKAFPAWMFNIDILFSALLLPSSFFIACTIPDDPLEQSFEFGLTLAITALCFVITSICESKFIQAIIENEKEIHSLFADEVLKRKIDEAITTDNPQRPA